MPVRLFDSAHIAAKLKPYGCRKISVHPEGFELWETGWGEAFTLSPTPDGRCDEWQIEQVLCGVIAQTMPDNWNAA